MKKIKVVVNFDELHAQVCNLSASCNWLQNPVSEKAVAYPLITPDMRTLMQSHYASMFEHVRGVLCAWTDDADVTEIGCEFAFTVPHTVDAPVVRSMIESYMIDFTMRKFSHPSQRNSTSGTDQTLYLLCAMFVPDNDFENDCYYGF